MNATMKKRTFLVPKNPKSSSVPLEVIAKKPHQAQIQQLGDIDGDGKPEVVIRDAIVQGYFEQDTAGNWHSFQPFSSVPTIDWNDPNLRTLDLNGDGRADLLLTTDQVFRWFPSLGKEGHGTANETFRFQDEEKGPALVFADSEQTIFLADMSGDGLTDLVRVRNGETAYWPNLGFGKFGAKVNMAHAPWFDRPDQFDPRRLRLADTDGSGTSDLIYFGKKEVQYWLNQAGNSFALQQTFTHFPKVDNLAGVHVIDLFGKGTACLVWSTSLPSDHGMRVRYLDLSKEKPYLLKQINNNMGALTKMHYAPSTKFYVRDRRAGTPWITKLPFPVQVLERTETLDEITGSKFVSLYAYHHGYFDPLEREFRGFGMVEQWDTEHYDDFGTAALFEVGSNHLEEASHIPPVHSKTWFHTGAYLDGTRISTQYQKEYYSADAAAWELPETTLPTGLSAREEAEAVRAMRGKPLRVEVYAEDGSLEQEHPYSVSTSSYQLRQIQPRAGHKHGVFLCTAGESLSYHYERNPADPRINHSLVLEQDEYGHPLKTASVAYPRRGTLHKEEQLKMWISYAEVNLLHDFTDPNRLRLGVPCESLQYEITGVLPPTITALKSDDLLALISTASELPYEESASGVLGDYEKRLLGHQKIWFYQDDLLGEEAFGILPKLALPHHSHNFALTEGLVEDAFNPDIIRVTSSMLTDDGKYVWEDGKWWIPSPVPIFEPTAFYLPKEITDPFGATTLMEYDEVHLFPISLTDVYGNSTSAAIDYRVLAPWETTDPNGNRQQVAFDVRGMVVATAIMGKITESLGDTLPDPTATLTYELFNWQDHAQPNYVKTSARERHQDVTTPWQTSYEYSGGLGQTLMVKVQAEDGEAFSRDTAGNLILGTDGKPIKAFTTDRWVGNGRTIFNNKGLPVKQYEPYFSNTFAYEEEDELVLYGVTPVLHYDALGRNIRTDNPDGTFTKVEFDPWSQTSYDQNDTVADSQWYIDRGSPALTDPEPTDPDTRAAWLALKHYDTPQIGTMDSMGRVFLTQDDYGTAASHVYVNTEVVLDIQSNQLTVIDARRFETVFLPSPIGMLYTNGPDSGWRRGLGNIAGSPLYAWDERGFAFRSTYDILQRPKGQFVTEGGVEKLVAYSVYGDKAGLATPENDNLRGVPVRSYDQSGLSKPTEIDFKGNPLASRTSICCGI